MCTACNTAPAVVSIMPAEGQMLVQYDQDVVTWSPQGRIHQIEYAMEAVKQGSAVVGLKVSSGLRLKTDRHVQYPIDAGALT